MALVVNGFEIADAAIQREAERLLKEVQQTMPWLDPQGAKLQAQDMARDRIVEHRLLYEEAQRSIEEPTTEELQAEYDKVVKRHGGEAKFLKQFKMTSSQVPSVKKEIAQDLKMQRYLAQLNRQVPQPTEAEARAHFEQNAKRYTTPDRYKASHIVLHTNQGQEPEAAKAKAEECLRRLNAGEATFEELADEVSDCPGKGGDLGWFDEGHMVEEFEKVVFKLEKGSHSQVFQTPFGYHIARLDDKKAGGLRDFDEVKPSILEELTRAKRDAFFRRKIEELKAQATITG